MFLQLLQRNADYHPNDIAIVYGDESITHAEMLDRVEHVAGGLTAMGISAGDKVALLLENSPEFIISFFAVAACRAVNVPLNIEFKEDEVKFYLTDADVKCVIADGQRMKTASGAASSVAHDVSLISTNPVAQNATPFHELLAAEKRSTAANSSLDDDIIYIYSSGSTGRPKCAPRTVVQYWWEMDDVVKCLDLGRSDTIFCVLPLFHNWGAVQCMLTAAGSGAKLVIFKNPNPFVLRRQSALKQLESEGVTIFPAVPFIFEHLVECSKTADLSNIRICYTGGAAASADMAEAFQEKFGIPLRGHYGCTEVGAMTIDLDPIPSQLGKSVGKPLPGVQVQILDDEGQPLPPNEKGEVVVRSRAMTRGYLGLDELNQQAFRGDRFYTGDLGSLDEDGRLFLLGRKKFVIDVVGHKVDPFEVEDVLAEHELVQDSVVIGVPNEVGDGDMVKAYVLARPGCDDRELMAFCRERLANFKSPQSIDFISELPKNHLGKLIRKREVLDQYVCSDDTTQALAGGL